MAARDSKASLRAVPAQMALSKDAQHYLGAFRESVFALLGVASHLRYGDHPPGEPSGDPSTLDAHTLGMCIESLATRAGAAVDSMLERMGATDEVWGFTLDDERAPQESEVAHG